MAWNWDFGDGKSSSDRNPSYTYAVGGTYNVTLTVTDDVGATDEVSKGISVSEAGIRLSATGYKVKGVQHADLNWSDADSTNIDIYRNGALITTTANDGAYTDNIGQKGGGTYTYQACEAGTSTCSNEATVVL